MATIQDRVAQRRAARQSRNNESNAPRQSGSGTSSSQSSSPRRSTEASGATRPVDPGRGTRGTGSITSPARKTKSPETSFGTLQDALDAATDERRRTGTVSRATEAAIERGRSDPSFLNDEEGFIGAIARQQGTDPNTKAFEEEQAEFARRLIDPNSPFYQPGPQEKSIAQRQEAGAPLQDPRSGIRGPGTGTGGTVERGREGINIRTGLEQLGELDRSAFMRLTRPREEGGGGLSPVDALQRIEDLKPSISDTLSNTGLGGTNRGSEVGSSELRSKLQEDLDAVDKNLQEMIRKGTAGKNAATLAKQEKANILAEYNATLTDLAAQATAKRAEGEVNVTPTTTIAGEAPSAPQVTPESLFAGMGPEQSEIARNILGDGFTEGFNQRMGGVDVTTPEGKEALSSEATSMADLLKTLLGPQNELNSQMNEFTEDIKTEADRRAKEQLERVQRDQALSKRKQQAELNRTIREAEIKQEQNRGDWMTGLGLESGWFSSTRSAAVIRALSAGERIISDRKADLAFTNEFYTNKSLDAEENYHNATVDNSNAYRSSTLQLKEKMNAQAANVTNTIYNTDQEAKKAAAKVKEDWVKEQTRLTERQEDRAWENTKFFTQEERLIQGQSRQNQTAVYNRSKDGITQGLHSNPTWLSQMNSELTAAGLSPIPQGLQTQSQIEDALDRMGDERDAQRFSPGQYKISGVSYGDIMNSVASRGTAANAPEFKENAFALLETGDYQGAMDLAIANGLKNLPAGLEVKFQGADLAVTQTQVAVKDLTKMWNEGGLQNAYKNFGETKLKRLSATNKDALWLKSVQNTMFAIENWRHNLTGAQFTEMEKDRVALYLPDFERDTLKDAMIKAQGFWTYVNRERNSISNQAIGKFGSSKLSGTQLFSAKSQQPSSNDRFKQYESQINGSTPARPTSHVPKGALGGMTSKSNYIAWKKGLGAVTQGYNTPVSYMKSGQITPHGGVDLSMGQAGFRKDIPSLTAGEIISIDGSKTDTKGWGKRVIIKDDQGNLHQYSHLDEVPQWIEDAYAANGGVYIQGNDPIGKMGKSGFVIGETGIHLDYRIKDPAGNWVDPETYYI